MDVGEVSLSRTWLNIPESVVTVSVLHITPNVSTTGLQLKGSRYRSAEHLLRELQKVTDRGLGKDLEKRITFHYDSVSRPVRIKITSSGYKLVLPPAMAVTLSLGKDSAFVVITGLPFFDLLHDIPEGAVVETGRNVQEPYAANVNRLLPCIFIYCNIVQHERVGDFVCSVALHHRPTRE